MLSYNFCIYILECGDGSYYTGVTNDLDRRLWEHDTGFNITCYTYSRRPVKLRYYEITGDIKQDFKRKTIKRVVAKKERSIVQRRLAGINKIIGIFFGKK